MIEIIPNWHPVLVHYTVALLSLSVVLWLLAQLLPATSVRNEMMIVARWSLWLGTLITIVTTLAGWDAYNSVAHDEESHIAMTDHRNWALATLALFATLASWSLVLWWRSDTSPSGITGAGFMVALAIGGLLLAGTAWRGGELVYRHGLGVMSLPVTDVDDAQGGPVQGEGLTSSGGTAGVTGTKKPPVHEHSTHKH